MVFCSIGVLIRLYAGNSFIILEDNQQETKKIGFSLNLQRLYDENIILFVILIYSLIIAIYFLF